mgnify:CR=1 FL=1
METIDLLVSLDENYLPQLRVMLYSASLNNPGVNFRVFLLHRGFSTELLSSLSRQLEALDMELRAIRVDERLFENAPVMKQYPQEMYYRLLAAQLLPEDMDRIIYLDPDILVINPLTPLWRLDMGSKLFAAAAHTGMTELANNVNRLRLGTERDYFNSGVLLIDLARCRAEVNPEEIFSYVSEHAEELLLPDQDILNALYSSRILELDDALWNYDARNFKNYLMRSNGAADMEWVIENTAVLHFCGRAKPWKPHYRHRFGMLYLHYEQLTRRALPELD